MNKVKVKKYIIPVIAALCAVSVVLLVFSDLSAGSRYSDAFTAMNTVVTYNLRGGDSDAVGREIKSRSADFEKVLLSRYSPASDVSRINSAPGEAVTVSPQVADIISRAVDVYNDSDGAFDVTLGKVTALWGFGTETPRVPGEKELEDALRGAGSYKIRFSGNSVTIGKDQQLDPGAVGKGAACDLIAPVLRENGVKSGVVCYGGSILVYGKKSLKIGIALPGDVSKSMATLKLKDTCVSTSGDYEQCFTENGVTYHHILNPLTGRPVESGLSSVTVVCSSGTLSDALSTACFIMGDCDRSRSLLKKYGAQAVFVYKDKTVSVTGGLGNDLTLTDTSFKLK